MNLTKEDAIYISNVFEDYFGHLERIDDYMREQKLASLSGLPSNPLFPPEDDLFSDFSMHPNDMEFSVMEIPNSQWDTLLNITSSHINGPSPGRNLKLVVMENKTKKFYIDGNEIKNTLLLASSSVDTIFENKEELYFDIYRRFVNHIFKYTKIPEKEKYLEGCFVSSPVFKEDGILSPLYKQAQYVHEPDDLNITRDIIIFPESTLTEHEKKWLVSLLEACHTDAGEEDDKIYDLQIPIDKVVIKWPRNTSTKIEINQKTGLIMKYVEADVFNDREFLDSGNDALFKLLCKSIAQIYDGEIVYDCSTYTLQEIEQFVEGLDSKIFEKLIEFVSNTPSLYYQLEYTNSKGTKRTIELKSLQDFFTLR